MCVGAMLTPPPPKKAPQEGGAPLTQVNKLGVPPRVALVFVPPPPTPVAPLKVNPTSALGGGEKPPPTSIFTQNPQILLAALPPNAPGKDLAAKAGETSPKKPRLVPISAGKPPYNQHVRPPQLTISRPDVVEAPFGVRAPLFQHFIWRGPPSPQPGSQTPLSTGQHPLFCLFLPKLLSSLLLPPIGDLVSQNTWGGGEGRGQVRVEGGCNATMSCVVWPSPAPRRPPSLFGCRHLGVRL